MTTEEIKKIAKKFELDMYPTMPDMLSAQAMLEWLSKDYCIVPKVILEKFDIAWRAKQYGTVILNQSDVEKIFPELFNEQNND